MVHVFVRFKTIVDRRFNKRLVKREQFRLFETSYRYGSFRTVEIVGDVHVSFHFSEVWENVYKRPFVISHCSPTVIIFRNSPQKYLAIYRTGSSYHLSSGCRQHFCLITRPLCHPRPVMRCPLGRCVRFIPVFQIIRIIRAGFQEQYGAAVIFCQPRGDHTSRGSCAYNNDIVFQGISPNKNANLAPVLVIPEVYKIYTVTSIGHLII